MNTKSLLLAILAAFLTVFATDFLIHGLWMAPVYGATKSLWRPDSEMQAHTGWIMAGQLLAAATFATIWAAGFAERRHLRCAVMFGLFMALFSQAHTIISYAVSPLTLEIVWKWFVGGVLQGILLGVVTFFVYKPAVTATRVSA